MASVHVCVCARLGVCVYVRVCLRWGRRSGGHYVWFAQSDFTVLQVLYGGPHWRPTL
jgi:hypothetical protein